MKKFFKSFKQLGLGSFDKSVFLSWQQLSNFVQVKFNKMTINKQSTIDLLFPFSLIGMKPVGDM